MQNISQAQIFYTALVVVVLVIAVWIYSALRRRRAEQAEIDKLLNDYAKSKGQDSIIATEYDLPVELVSKARDVAFNVSVLLKTNKDLTWWERNSESLLFVSQWIWGNKGVWQEDIDKMVAWLNRVRNREEALLVQTFYEEFTGGRNLKIDMDKHIPVPDRRNIAPYRFFN